MTTPDQLTTVAYGVFRTRQVGAITEPTEFEFRGVLKRLHSTGILEAGLQALATRMVNHHDERHLLSNCIGMREMRVEIGAPTKMSALDTLFLGTDGVLDNIHRGDLIDLIRVGPIQAAAAELQTRVRATMGGSDPTLPAHPDDATTLLFRRLRR